ncbi:hypothetical protein JM946_00810 [Steroidobacter sp. S1-65]|uniref:Uncharacterized protein n=1 Tax=Steroidobacter gossypii TaxID=2805490 RepID=A0ABS1WQK4_9GAMM|nr:hypothetical protein [Steroidobacter gossypii]MBM0103257.1 hypothetical protein [Steroidobacter gossypii]
MFPTGQPGIALLFLRASVAATLLFAVLPAPFTLSLKLAGAVIALALLVGIASSVCAALCCIAELAFMLTSSGTVAICSGLAALISLALALLGPGGYSVDARAFGRRRIIFTRHGGDEER